MKQPMRKWCLLSNIHDTQHIIHMTSVHYDLSNGTWVLHFDLSLHSWPSRAWKKVLLAFLSSFWHPCLKCILMYFKKDRGGCQVWKRPEVPELGQRSNECKFLYIRQILAFLSISYPKLWLKVMQKLFWIIQPCYINKQYHQGMMCVWIKGHLSAKSVKIVAIFYAYRGKIQMLSSLLP